MSNFIQIGVTALRDPATGELMPAVPLYIEAPEDETDETATAEMADRIAPLFAEMMKSYVMGCRKGGVKP